MIEMRPYNAARSSMTNCVEYNTFERLENADFLQRMLEGIIPTDN